jgi:aspartate 1-decarboxylase
VIGINGAAAHLVSPGNLVIVLPFVHVDESERASHLAKVVHVDSANRIVALGSDPSQPVPGALDQVAGA